ncbi:hypothetical protein CBS101457_004407 [Exobasidium rhododendri]|nr:hypothetical protein CBS101457_004407 [Exobasidium rhododendri]
MNPNARNFAFNPAASGFVPPQLAAQYATPQQGSAEGGAPNGQVPPQQQQAGGAYYEQGLGSNSYNFGQQNYGGFSQQPQQGGYYAGNGGNYTPYDNTPQQQYNNAHFQQDTQSSVTRSGNLPPRPSAADDVNRKPVSLSIGGAKPSTSNPSAEGEARKPVTISLGAKSAAADKKPVSISLGGGAKKLDSVSSSTNSTNPTTATAPVAKDEATQSASESGTSTPGQVSSRNEVPYPDSKGPGAGQAAKKTAKIDQKVEKSQTDAVKILEEASKATDEETMRDLFGDKVDTFKAHLNVVFIGHVDAGKSTMGGNLLYLTGMVDKRTMEKYEKEAKEAGRESWYLSWALDSTPQEREKGKTVEVGRAYFETGKRRYTILDAPGHKSYVPSMISGAAQADIAILVISARRGEFETGFERGGQTREHAMLVKTAGVQRLIVVVNKMDEPTVKWEKERYDEIVTKLTPFLRSAGFNPKTDLTFIPVSAYAGQNLKEVVPKEVCPWYSGPSLLDFLDNLSLDDRKINEPLKMPISEKYTDMGTVVVGKLESGKVRKGDTMLLMPNRTSVEVLSIFNEVEEEVPAAISGDNVRIKIKGVDHEDVSVGFVLTDPRKPVNVVRQFEAQVAILETRNIICAGYTAVMHVHTLSEEITLTALLHYYDKKTGKKSRKPPQFAKKGMKVVALIETTAPISVERFVDYPQLGRFTIRDEGRTVGIGKITKLSPQLEEVPDVGKITLEQGPANA